MIRLFKKIRHQLLQEDRYSIYILYATGEVVLVMVGILLALQIDNWNSNRNQDRLEQDYYLKLLEDVNQDRMQIEKHLNENEDRIGHSNKLIHLLQQANPDRNEITQHLLGSISKTTYTFKPSLAAFQDLISSGNLNILKDNYIKTMMIDYYSVLEGYTDVIDVNSDQTVEIYFDKRKDFSELGWQNFEFVKKEIDSNLVNLSALNTEPFPSVELRKQLTSDAVFYLTTSARKKMIYQEMEELINNVLGKLSEKCNK